MSYFSIDEQCMMKLEKYVKKLEGLYPCIAALTDIEIDDGYYGLAVAQCITNIYEIVTRLHNAEIIGILVPLLQKTRIAAHDYDAINWSLIKKNCLFIISFVTPKLIADCYGIAASDKQGKKDYTSNS